MNYKIIFNIVYNQSFLDHLTKKDKEIIHIKNKKTCLKHQYIAKVIFSTNHDKTILILLLFFT